MPLGKREKKWLRPISEMEGGDVHVGAPEVSPLPLPPQPQPQPQPQPLPLPPQPQTQQMEGGTADFLSIIINTLNTNPYFIGMLMLLMNLGGRFLALELTPRQEQFLQQRWLRPLLFFTVIFIATRNLAVAFWMTLALFLVLWILANEQSPFCLISSWRPTQNYQQEKEQRYEQNVDFIESVNHSGRA